MPLREQAPSTKLELVMSLIQNKKISARRIFGISKGLQEKGSGK